MDNRDVFLDKFRVFNSVHLVINGIDNKFVIYTINNNVSMI